jgi:hypothetical protein
VFELKQPCIRKIAINPKNHYQFLVAGKSYLKMYDVTDAGALKVVNEPMISLKYERDNDFIEAVYIQESIFVVASA